MIWKRKEKRINGTLEEYLENIFEEELNKGYKLKVCVGTDSQKVSKFTYKFATVILITTTQDLGGVIVGRGGLVISSTYFNTFKKTDKELVNERMVYEVSKSIEVAYDIAPLLDLYELPLEIHADINKDPVHESNKALQQTVGYILGMGYEFKVKPDAYAASTIADKKC